MSQNKSEISEPQRIEMGYDHQSFVYSVKAMVVGTEEALRLTRNSLQVYLEQTIPSDYSIGRPPLEMLISEVMPLKAKK